MNLIDLLIIKRARALSRGDLAAVAILEGRIAALQAAAERKAA